MVGVPDNGDTFLELGSGVCETVDSFVETVFELGVDVFGGLADCLDQIWEVLFQIGDNMGIIEFYESCIILEILMTEVDIVVAAIIEQFFDGLHTGL